MDRCDGTDPATLPSYDETRADWLAECAPPGGASRLPIVKEAGCSPSGLRFLQINRGLGMERRYFDSEGVFVGVLTESDRIDPVCSGLRDWPKHTRCDVQSPPKVLCGAGS